MAHSDNFKRVVAAIEAERNKADSSGVIELKQTKENKLNTVPIEHIRNILQDLDFGARVIEVVKENRPNKEEPWPQLWDPQKLRDSIYNSGISFTVEILGTYEEWFAEYTDSLTDSPKPAPTKKPSLRVPADAKWEDISIKFVDGHNVDIKYKGKNYRSDFKEMGFEDLKSRRPNKQWELLLNFAANKGEIAWDKSPSGSKFDLDKTEQDFGYEMDDDTPESAQNKGFSVIKAPDKTKKTTPLPIPQGRLPD
jgi:hypothetical protein